MGIRIYGAQLSPFVRKVRVCLQEKGIEYDLDPVNPFGPPQWFREISPLGKIPVLRDEDVGTEGAEGTIPDSSAICFYLERKFPQPSLYPEDAFACARALWYEEYADTELAAHIGPGVFQPMVLRRFIGKDADEARARETIEQKLPPALDYLEKEIGDREFLVADRFSIADIAVATQFCNLRLSGFDVDRARWPRLAAFLERAHQRSSFRKCVEEETAILDALLRR